MTMASIVIEEEMKGSEATTSAVTATNSSEEYPSSSPLPRQPIQDTTPAVTATNSSEEYPPSPLPQQLIQETTPAVTATTSSEEYPPSSPLPQEVLDTAIMLRHVVPSDNACLFASVFFIKNSRDGDAEDMQGLRNIVAEKVSSDPTKFNEGFLGKPNEEYSTWIKDPRHWGGAIEVAIFSELYEIELVVLHTTSLRMHRFGENENYHRRGFLIYDGIHYDPLAIDFDDHHYQTLFRISDARAMKLAMEVGQEDILRHRYTNFSDVPDVMLCCKKCNAVLHGKGEARIHAIETNHVDIDEVTE